MSGDATVLGYEFAGRGPAQLRLLEWLRARVDAPIESAVAQRSPAGPWAIKLHAPNRVPTCAQLLQAEPWVERVAVRPQHLYVRVTAERLCEWVVEAFAAGGADPVAGDEGAGRSVLVRAADADAVAAAGVPRTLRLFRETAVARSVAALLRSRGFDVTLELLPPGGETYDEVWAAAPGSVTHTVVVGSGVGLPTELERGDHVVHLPVGEVDVRHGPLRARNGGSVSADDVVAEIARALPAGRRETLASAEAATAYGGAVLALLLLATPRAQRIQLDDRAMQREMATFACLADVVGRGDTADATQEADARDGRAATEAARDLAAELDLIATNAARGATALDPALVARSLRSIAERFDRLDLTAGAPAQQRLRSAGCEAAAGALSLAALAPDGRWTRSASGAALAPGAARLTA